MIEEKLRSNIQELGAPPIFFIGSGISRRYIGLETWEALLTRFCTHKPFSYYRTSANSNMPGAAGKLAEDFHSEWFKSNAYLDNRAKLDPLLIDMSSPLKIEISNYLHSKTAIDPRYNNEIAAFKDAAVDAIITTNWDCFLEQTFPQYKTVIGQEGLFSAPSFGVGEIYKIHGCSTDPNSLVLTDKDYEQFNDRNPYLSSRLLAMLIERPVFFLGYSLGDDNIQSILRSVVKCLNAERLKNFQKRVFVVVRNEHDESMTESLLTFDGTPFPITLIQTDRYEQIYKSTLGVKRKVPPQILRFLKEQVVELIKTSEPSEKVKVLVGIDGQPLGEVEKLNVVVGVGISQNIGDQGYAPITIRSLQDMVLKRVLGNYDAMKILQLTLPDIFEDSQVKNVPLFFFLKAAGVKSGEGLKSLIGAENVSQNLLKRLDCGKSFYVFNTKVYATGKWPRPIKEWTEEAVAGLTDEDEIYRAAAQATYEFIRDPSLPTEVLRKLLHRSNALLNSEDPNKQRAYKKALCVLDLVENWDPSMLNDQTSGSTPRKIRAPRGRKSKAPNR
jgi:hypothetical protein